MIEWWILPAAVSAVVGLLLLGCAWLLRDDLFGPLLAALVAGTAGLLCATAWAAGLVALHFA